MMLRLEDGATEVTLAAWAERMVLCLLVQLSPERLITALDTDCAISIAAMVRILFIMFRYSRVVIYVFVCSIVL
jgi:hypothetical protein